MIKMYCDMFWSSYPAFSAIFELYLMVLTMRIYYCVLCHEIYELFYFTDHKSVFKLVKTYMNLLMYMLLLVPENVWNSIIFFCCYIFYKKNSYFCTNLLFLDCVLDGVRNLLFSFPAAFTLEGMIGDWSGISAFFLLDM